MDQYDVIGQLYERTKTLPVGLAEQGTLLAALPDLTGKSVLDVGTGTGFYPRKYKALGASTVVGVDASTEMITYARRVEEQAPLGITYEIDNGAALPKLGEFDVVTAIWLLGYAEGRRRAGRDAAEPAGQPRPGRRPRGADPQPGTGLGPPGNATTATG